MSEDNGNIQTSSHEVYGGTEDQRFQIMQQEIRHKHRINMLVYLTGCLAFLVWMFGGMFTALIAQKEKPCICKPAKAKTSTQKTGPTSKPAKK